MTTTTATMTVKSVQSKRYVQNHLAPLINPQDFSIVTKKLRLFFEQKGFQEVHTQNRLSIMAACEDPSTIATYHYAGELWPLPQTGQMWLEYELLNNPDVPGFFCLSTSYRNEPNPVPGRHNLIFPMFEFETHGGLEALVDLCTEMCEFLGFPKEGAAYPGGDYEDVAAEYHTDILEREHEEQIGKDYGPAFFLKNFPERTSPFWNMKRNEDNPEISNKLDVLLHGMETIGSAERSCNAEEQRRAFLSIEDGLYAQKLYDLFGEERVNAELDEFFSLNFIKRCGGGIGVTRMIRAMKLSGLMK